MTRMRQNFIAGTVDDNPLLVGATTLTSTELANLQAIAAPEVAVVVLDPTGAAPEIVHVTAHTASATTATIARGKEGTAAAEHAVDTPWRHVPTAEDFRTYTGGTALTNHTPNNTTMEQWGTEEAIVLQELCPTEAVVLAWLTGSAGYNAAVAGDRGEYKMAVSFDGGTSWADLGDAGVITTVYSAAAGKRHPLAAVGRASGTVTGDVQVRAMVRDIDGANDMVFADGYLAVMVHPS